MRTLNFKQLELVGAHQQFLMAIREIDGKPRITTGQFAISNVAFQTVDVAQELEDEAIGRMTIERIRFIDLLDASVAHYHNPIGKLQRLFLIVGHEHAGKT